MILFIPQVEDSSTVLIPAYEQELTSREPVRIDYGNSNATMDKKKQWEQKREDGGERSFHGKGCYFTQFLWFHQGGKAAHYGGFACLRFKLCS